MSQNSVNKTHLAWMLITIIQIIAMRPFATEGGGQVFNLLRKVQMAISGDCRVRKKVVKQGLMIIKAWHQHDCTATASDGRMHGTWQKIIRVCDLWP